MSAAFEYTIFIGKTPGEIWDALTRKELVDRYYLAPLLRLEAHAGDLPVAFTGSQPIRLDLHVDTAEDVYVAATVFNLDVEVSAAGHVAAEYRAGHAIVRWFHVPQASLEAYQARNSYTQNVQVA